MISPFTKSSTEIAYDLPEPSEVNSNGVFIYQLRAGEFMQSRKMMLVR